MLKRVASSLMIIALAACLSFPLASADEPASFRDSIIAITMETTPAWGEISALTTTRIVLTPQTGEITEIQVGASDGRIRGSEAYVVSPAQIASLADTYLPALLEWPLWDGGTALDGWYTHIEIDFQGSYSMRFGGHVADEIGPIGFQRACEAIRGLLAEAKDADGA